MLILETLLRKWKNYRYRFLPWVLLNITNRANRVVRAGKDDKVVEDAIVLNTMLKLLTRLYPSPSGQTCLDTSRKNYDIMTRVLGYGVVCGQSKLPEGGTGVFLSSGSVSKGTLLAFYPGTIYREQEPILLPSLGNAFIFRCIDGIHIDGNNRALSKMIYKSCVGRDSMWPYQASDVTWLTSHPVIPWNVGQYVNNEHPDFPANVAYQELTIPLANFTLKLRGMLPNIWYNSGSNVIRLVGLVSTRNIKEGEEILANYYTFVL